MVVKHGDESFGFRIRKKITNSTQIHVVPLWRLAKPNGNLFFGEFIFDDDYPIIYRVLTIPGGAGFCPSTVCPMLRFTLGKNLNFNHAPKHGRSPASWRGRDFLPSNSQEIRSRWFNFGQRSRCFTYTVYINIYIYKYAYLVGGFNPFDFFFAKLG